MAVIDVCRLVKIGNTYERVSQGLHPETTKDGSANRTSDNEKERRNAQKIEANKKPRTSRGFLRASV